MRREKRKNEERERKREEVPAAKVAEEVVPRIEEDAV